jgi:hypothetical protein
VIDCTEFLDGRLFDAEFFVQFALDSLLGTLTFLDATARRSVKTPHRCSDL